MEYLGYILCLLFFVLGMLIYRLIIQKRLSEHSAIKKQAFTDPLTRKGNRHKFLKDMDTAISKSRKFAICFMDLDGFKHVNDTFGHDAGDYLLIELSKMLEESLPMQCEAYRLGGDEFSIIIPNVNTIDEISNILDRLKEGLKKPVVIENTKIVLEYSLGIAIYPTDAENRSDLMNYADDAMYYIKENGKNAYYFHNEALKSKLNNKKKMEIDLKESFKNNHFAVEFQPRINVNNIDEVYLEALVYWKHPVLGKLTADYFIKQAEEIGLVTYLDEFVVAQSCEVLDELKKQGFHNVKLCINISNAHAKRHDLSDKLCSKIKEYNFNKGEIYIEFNNRLSIKNLNNYKFIVDSLKAVGAKVSISNLEIRYDILKMFKELNFDEIKLSSEYLSKESNLKPSILNNIVNVCQDVGLSVTVSKIESEKELELVKKSNACKMQGNHIFKRIDRQDLQEFLRNYPDFKSRLESVLK